MTPHELNELLKRYGMKQERLDFRAALVACTIANCNRDPKSDAYAIEDFMPGKRAKSRRQTADQMVDKLTEITARLGGAIEGSGSTAASERRMEELALQLVQAQSDEERERIQREIAEVI